jgi:hypothetical protein
MSLDYICNQYGVPAKKGGRVLFRDKKYGTIVGTSGPHLKVKFDGESKPVVLHPTWELEYLTEAREAQ